MSSSGNTLSEPSSVASKVGDNDTVMYVLTAGDNGRVLFDGRRVTWSELHDQLFIEHTPIGRCCVLLFYELM